MNRLIPLIGMMVLVAALTGAAIGWMGWRSPFSGRRASNQLDTTTQNRQATGTQNLRTNQPTKTAQNNQTQPLGANQPATTAQKTTTQTTAQAPDAAENPDTSGTAAQSDDSQTVPALW